MERLQKILSQAGVASRRAAEQLMLDGRVTVNGTTVRELGTKADPAADDIRVDGRRVKVAARHRYILLNKPRGYVTTRSDPQRRPTVVDLLAGVREYVYPVGRLDFDSEGLLLLTNDGDLAARLTHPSHEVRARVRSARRRRARRARSRAAGARPRRSTAAGPRRGRQRSWRRGRAARHDHGAGRPEPSGAEDVRRDRPSGRSPAPRRDRADPRHAAEAGPVAGADGQRKSSACAAPPP